jgi:hypothetical protein
MIESNNISLNGSIYANGQNGIGSGGNPGGGGAGGTVFINTTEISGQGLLNATGGNGAQNSGFQGGGGSGGRISLIVDNNNFNGSYNVLRGEGFELGSTGTLFPFNIICDLGTSQTECIIQSEKEVSNIEGTGDLIIREGGNLISSENLNLEFSDIEVKNGGKLNVDNNLDFGDTDDVIFKESEVKTGSISANNTNLAGSKYNLSVTEGVYFNDFISNYSIRHTGEWINASLIKSKEFINFTGINPKENISIKGFTELRGNINLSGQNIDINEGAVLNATGEGYRGGISGATRAGSSRGGTGNGPGGTLGTIGTGSGGAGGAGFGSLGGNGQETGGGSSYKSTTSPTSLGSGGGGSTFESGGSGGRKSGNICK